MGMIQRFHAEQGKWLWKIVHEVKGLTNLSRERVVEYCMALYDNGKYVSKGKNKQGAAAALEEEQIDIRPRRPLTANGKRLIAHLF